MDPFGRIIDYLRISVTDRCNERCLYCMPEGYKGWAQRPDHLTADEIMRVVESACSLGFRKFRLTGGEPLLRADIVEIARRMGAMKEVHSLGLSTNGTLLDRVAEDLREAGVHSINISLDALDPTIYHRISGGKVQTALAGIQAALNAGFPSVKLNCVLMRGVNEQEIWPLVMFAAEHGVPLRFIELMPLTRTDVLSEANFLPIGEAMQMLADRDKLIAQPDHQGGHGPARYYRLETSGAMVGFIGALTTPHFCGTCNKLRLTADGKLRPCLGRHGEIDLLAPLRSGANINQLIDQAIATKPENHEFSDVYEPGRPMTAIGG